MVAGAVYACDRTWIAGVIIEEFGESVIREIIGWAIIPRARGTRRSDERDVRETELNSRFRFVRVNGGYR